MQVRRALCYRLPCFWFTCIDVTVTWHTIYFKCDLFADACNILCCTWIVTCIMWYIVLFPDGDSSSSIKWHAIRQFTCHFVLFTCHVTSHSPAHFVILGQSDTETFQVRRFRFIWHVPTFRAMSFLTWEFFFSLLTSLMCTCTAISSSNMILFSLDW